MNHYSNIAKILVIVNLTEDLPNGPYCIQMGELIIKVHISQSLRVAEMKAAIEKFVADELVRRAEAIKGQGVKIAHTWTITSFMYKGGNLAWETPLSIITSGDELQANVTVETNWGWECCCSLI